MGRISLNPLAHIDPIGTVVMPLLMLATGIPLIGWAKPVPVNPRNFHNRSRGNILVSLAGPASNLLLVVAFAIILRLTVVLTDADPRAVIAAFVNPSHAVAAVNPLLLIASMMVIINLILMLFNLIPVPPLDGSHLLYEIVGERGQRVMDQIGPFGIIIVLLVGGNLIKGPLYALLNLIIQFVLLGQV